MTRKVIIAVSVGLLGSLLLWAGAWGVADLATLGPRHIMAVLEKDSTGGDKVDWDSANASLLKAHRFNPINADYVYDLGRLNEWRIRGLPVWEPTAHKYRAKAIESFELALTMRPSSNLMWIQLAHSKVLNQEVDKETFEALEKAIVFGPWAEGTRLKMIWVGIALWDALPVSQKDQLKKVIVRALRHKDRSRYVIATAVWLGWEKNLRPLITDEDNEKMLERTLKWFGKR